MATAQKNINDYYTIKKRINDDKGVSKCSKSDCFKVPYPPNATIKNPTVIKSVVTPKRSIKSKKCDSIDIRDALKKAISLEKLINSNQEEPKTPKRKETSPIFGDTLSLSDSKKKKTLDNQKDGEKSCEPSNIQILPNTAQLQTKIRKKIFQDDNIVKNDLPNQNEEKVKKIVEELSCPFVPLSPLASSPTKPQPVASSTEASQKLSLEQVKSRLVNCSKLSELKQRLVSINDCASKLIEFQKRTSSPVKINLAPGSPSKSSRPVLCNLLSPKKILEKNDENLRSSLAFEKRERVVSTEPGLPLPIKFQALSELFNSLDIVVAMLFNRKESCPFDKVKASVQKMLRKNFDVKKLGIIATVFPDAYTYTIQKWCKKERIQSDYQLILTPKIDCDRMLPTHLSERKETFYNKLLDIVKDHHKQFLSNLDPPIIIDNNSLRRWHPRFKLHDIADIEVNSTVLPKLPENEEQGSKSSVEKFLLHSQEQLGLDVPTQQENYSAKPPLSRGINDKITSGLLKGVSKNLLDKIRAKEAKTMVKELTRNPIIEKRLSMIKRLPDLMKIIHNYFIGQSKAAQLMEEVIKKCIESYHIFISNSDVEEQIQLLTELLPDWIYVLKVRKGVYLKIDKQKNLNELFVRLEKASLKIRS